MSRDAELEILRLFELTPRTAVVPWLEANITLPAKMAPVSYTHLTLPTID